jgi:hypothetical protein
MASNKRLVWKWKDSCRRYWSVIAKPTGCVMNKEGSNPDGDMEWAWQLFDEENKCIWYGCHVGQLDQPPKLQHLLAEWQQDVNQVVIDGVAHEARERFSNAHESKALS